jgi:hypothetical protein
MATYIWWKVEYKKFHLKKKRAIGTVPVVLALFNFHLELT